MASQLTIRPYDAALDAVAVAALWQETLPRYPVAPQHLEQLLALPWGSHFVALVPDTATAVTDTSAHRLIGFSATYTGWLAAAAAGSTTAYLPVIIIHSDFQGTGYGTRLLRHSLEHLWESFQEVKVGCPIPRFWPGLPTDLPSKDQEFFTKRGFVKHDTTSTDFYQPLATFQAPRYLLDRTSSSGISFAPLTASGYDECIAALESKFPQWAGAYRSLHSEGLHDNIMVAFDGSGRQVGWTLMLMPGQSRLWHGFAFLPVAGGEDGISGEGKTALIAAVGVSEDARGKGVGLGLIVAGMDELKKRGGVDGVFIDWVKLENFYEKVGFVAWGKYQDAVAEKQKQ